MERRNEEERKEIEENKNIFQKIKEEKGFIHHKQSVAINSSLDQEGPA